LKIQIKIKSNCIFFELFQRRPELNNQLINFVMYKNKKKKKKLENNANLASSVQLISVRNSFQKTNKKKVNLFRAARLNIYNLSIA
jgi:hypothetical protein